MIDIVAFNQLKAFARQDGAFMFLLWLVSFACYIFAPESPFGSLLAIATPFFLGWRLVSFRNEALDGVISFRRALAYCLYCFLYASLIFAVAQYIYFRFIDHGVFLSNLNNAMQIVEPVYRQNGIDTTPLQSGIQAFTGLKPLEVALLFMMQNLIIGAVVSPLVALACRRKSRNSDPQ